MPFVCQSYVYSYVICMSLICTRMSSICHSYVLVCHPCVTLMYSYVIRMSLVCTRMSSVCHSYVLVCYPYVTRMYSYVIRMSLVFTRMSSVCHSYVVFTMNLYRYSSSVSWLMHFLYLNCSGSACSNCAKASDSSTVVIFENF